MKILSYVVRRDYGFAPNPFFDWCTLATCKPKVRKTADVGDWVLGLGSAQNDLSGHIVFLMKVEEAFTFDTYWKDPRFREKRPNLRSSLKHAFGDNIYHHGRGGQWKQEPSHHSNSDGTLFKGNVDNDTQTDRVLASRTFCYWGELAPKVPKFLEPALIVRGHRKVIEPGIFRKLENWFVKRPTKGYLGPPAEWRSVLKSTRLG